jgi:crotonobetainyl-CoA:carnitine CoA-transferase CaiB-like acyl-CoA transferase
MKVELEHPLAGKVPLVASPMRFSATPLEFKAPPPTLGQHTDEVLRGVLDMSDADIAQLRGAGIVS